MREEGESIEGGGVRGEELEERRRINTGYEGKRKRLDERGEEEEKEEKRRKSRRRYQMTKTARA